MLASLKRLAARRSARNEVAFKRDLAAAREAAGLSQARLAELMGVDRSTVSRIERLDSNPRLSHVREYLTQCEAALMVGVVPRCEIEAERQELLQYQVNKAARLRYQYSDDDAVDGVSPVIRTALTRR